MLVTDTLAVLDAAGAEQAYLVATTPGGWTAIPLAASHPDRVQGLVLIHVVARVLATPDYPFGYLPAQFDRALEQFDLDAEEASDDVAIVAGSKSDDADFKRWWRRAGQRGASPTTAKRRLAALGNIDLRDLLPRVTAPALIPAPS